LSLGQKSSPVVVGIGEILWDLLPGGKQLGGAPANFVYQAKALGAEGYIVSRIGKDKLGTEILSQLEAYGLAKSLIQVDRIHPTGIVTVHLDQEGKPRFIIHENAAWDFIEFDPSLADLTSRADAVCFGSLCQRSLVSQKTIRNFLESTRADCLRVLDINLREPFYSKNIIVSLLEKCNVLKLNDEELKTLAELLSARGRESDILARLTEQFSLELIALTKGSEGSLLFARGVQSVHHGFSVKVEDTVGAGDAFTAALVLGILQRKELDRINEEANRLASFVCTQKGAWTKNLQAET
jgi:fructokinase